MAGAAVCLDPSACPSFCGSIEDNAVSNTTNLALVLILALALSFAPTLTLSTATATTTTFAPITFRIPPITFIIPPPACGGLSQACVARAILAPCSAQARTRYAP